MATKGRTNDLLTSYITAGVAALLILLMAARAGWTLWVIVPVGLLVGVYLVHSPRRQRRLTGMPPEKVVIKPVRAGGLRSRADRHGGWNSLGALTIRTDDPYILIKGESPPDGVAIAVPPGRWQVHVRAEMVTKPIHMRDAELRIVQDRRWIEENWDWTTSWEPQLTSEIGSAAQSGRVAVDAGLLRVHAGRRRTRRASRTITLQPGFADGAFGINVVRDAAGKVVAIVSRFG